MSTTVTAPAETTTVGPVPHQTGSLRLPARRAPTPTRARLRTVRLPLVALVAALLLVPTVVVAGSMATGWWATTGRPNPAAAGGGPAAQPPDADTAEPGLPAVPDDVKGWMTAQQVLDAFPPLTAAELFALFGVPANTATSTPLKDLAERGTGFDLTDLREWLKQHR